MPQIPNKDMIRKFNDISLRDLDDYLLLHELWREKWEHLTKEHREVFEKYINERL